MRVAVITPFVDKQHGTERVLAELLERLSVNYGVEVQLYAQRAEDIPFILARNATEKASVGKIVWHRVSAIPGPHLLQFIWWYFANRSSRGKEREEHSTPDLVYSPGINACDVDAITAHIVFHAFYEQVRQQLRLTANSPLHWPLIIHRILRYSLSSPLLDPFPRAPCGAHLCTFMLRRIPWRPVP